MKAADIAESFVDSDTFMTAFEQFCPDGSCIEGIEDS